MAKSTDPLGREEYPQLLLALREKIAFDLAIPLSEEEKERVFEDFVRIRAGELASIDPDGVRFQHPSFLILLQNEFTRFYNEFYAVEGEAVELSSGDLDELVKNLESSTMALAAQMFRDVDIDIRRQVFSDVIGPGSIGLRRLLSGYRLFRGDKPDAAFTSFFVQQYRWRMKDRWERDDIRRKRQEAVLEELRHEALREVWEPETKVLDREALAAIFFNLSRRPDCSLWRGYLRWLGRFGDCPSPILETYFMLSTGGEWDAVDRATPRQPVLDVVRLQELVEALDRRKSEKPGKDGQLEVFLAAEVEGGRLLVSPGQLSQLLREFDRFSARRVRSLARQQSASKYAEGKSGVTVFDRSVNRLIRIVEGQRKAMGSRISYALMAERTGMTMLDIAALDHFRRALGRVYSRRGKFLERVAAQVDCVLKDDRDQ